jgi:hypothetical protein
MLGYLLEGGRTACTITGIPPKVILLGGKLDYTALWRDRPAGSLRRRRNNG